MVKRKQNINLLEIYDNIYARGYEGGFTATWAIEKYIDDKRKKKVWAGEWLNQFVFGCWFLKRVECSHVAVSDCILNAGLRFNDLSKCPAQTDVLLKRSISCREELHWRCKTIAAVLIYETICMESKLALNSSLSAEKSKILIFFFR